jgi:CRISPR-associated endonuclease/helicase Cas3
VAALFHDVGKANADFLNMVLAPPSGHIADQLIRHEHISGLVLHHDATRAWLGPAGLDVEVITSAVLCHHLKVTAAPSDRGPSREWGGFETPRRVPLYLNHPDVRAIFHRVATLLGLPPFQGRFPEEIHHAHPVWDVILKRAKRSIIPRFTKGLHGTPRHRLLCALKAGLIASDSSASALAEQGCSIEQWILEASHKPPITPALVDQLILAPRRQAIEQRTGRPFQGHEFQGRLAAQAPPRALLLAGCGSGKTLAAWMWVQAQAARSSFSKAIFLYPTRATSTEGFKDYVWAAGRDGTLLTGTSKYELARLRAELEGAELDSILETPDDQLHYQRRAALDPPLSEADQRMDALPLWKKTFFAATVDQFLSFTENNYGAVILLPALADSVVILDEIHSYDAQMFNALLLLLKNFHLPVLCMTASLSAARREALELAGLVQFPAADDRPYLLDLEAQEQAPRYLVGTTFSMDAMGTALGALRPERR